MAQNIDYFDKLNLLKIIGRKLKKIAESKKINIGEWAELYIDEKGKKGIAQGDLSNILNGKKGVSSEKLIQIASAIGISQKQVDEIVKESKKDELKIYYGEDINTIPELDINTLKDIDFDNDELAKVLMQRELGREPTEHDLKMIKMAIQMVKNQEK